MRSHARLRGRSFQARSRCASGPFLGLFRGCFLVMMELAQGLVVGCVDEKIPVPPERADVVDHRGPGADALGCADLAEWFSQQLLRPEPFNPNGLGVPAVICGAGSALLAGFWPVLFAPTVSGERSAPCF